MGYHQNVATSFVYVVHINEQIQPHHHIINKWYLFKSRNRVLYGRNRIAVALSLSHCRPTAEQSNL